MNKMYVLPKDNLGQELYSRVCLLIKKNRGAWFTRGAMFGLAGGMLSIVLGTLLWAVVPLLAQDNLRTFLNISETVFFVLPLPLLMLGAHCLDLLEKTPPLLPLAVESQAAVFESLYRLRPQSPPQN